MPIDNEDPFAGVKEDKPSDHAPTSREVDLFHKNADTDNNPYAGHHTCGPSRNQASPGDHNHLGGTSKKLGQAMTLTGAKGGNAALASVIAFLVANFDVIDSTTA
jgi:hypothetical protein